MLAKVFLVYVSLYDKKIPPLFPTGIFFIVLAYLSYFPEITTFNVIPLFPTNKKMLKNAKARACESLGFRILLFASVRLNLPEILVIQPYQ